MLKPALPSYTVYSNCLPLPSLTFYGPPLSPLPPPASFSSFCDTRISSLIVSRVEKRQLYSKSLQWPKQKFKTILMQNFGGTTEILFPNMRGVGSPRMPHERWIHRCCSCWDPDYYTWLSSYLQVYSVKKRITTQLHACSKRPRIPKMQFMLRCFVWITSLYYLVPKETGRGKKKRMEANKSRRIYSKQHAVSAID